MYYKKALSLAYKYHKNQKRWCGQMYIYHPYRVACAVDKFLQKLHYNKYIIDMYKSIAVLHDVIEDTECNKGDLLKIFPSFIVNGVVCLTKKHKTNYMSYVRKIDDEYTIVKYFDTLDNYTTAKTSTKFLYSKALKILKNKMEKFLI